MTEHLEIHFIELSKLDKYYKDIENPLLCEWVEFLGMKNEVDMENLRDRKDLPEQIRKAIDELEILKQDANMQIEAFNKEIFIRDYFQGINDAMREGEIKGELKGENKTKLEIARNLLLQGFSIESISNATGLSIFEIDQLKDKL